MSKKLFSLAPLLAIVAFAVMPAASQAATPHWFKGGQTPGRKHQGAGHDLGRRSGPRAGKPGRLNRV